MSLLQEGYLKNFYTARKTINDGKMTREKLAQTGNCLIERDTTVSDYVRIRLNSDEIRWHNNTLIPRLPNQQVPQSQAV